MGETVPAPFLVFATVTLSHRVLFSSRLNSLTLTSNVMIMLYYLYTITITVNKMKMIVYWIQILTEILSDRLRKNRRSFRRLDDQTTSGGSCGFSET